jgi:sortase A
MSRQRLWLAAAIVGVLSVDGALVVGRAASSSADTPRPRVVAAAAELPPELPAPTTTSTTAPTVVIPRRSHPVDPAGTPGEPIVQIGTIEIPKIGLVHSIWEGITLRNINNGPSHWPGTALPGEPGNTVFAGHRVTHSHPFREIDKLTPGDEVIFTVNGKRSVYRVTGHDIVAPRDVWIANPTAEATGTLFACHPPGTKTYRYVVHLALVP